MPQILINGPYAGSHSKLQHGQHANLQGQKLISVSQVFILDETIAFRVALEDALDQTLCRVVLLVGTLVEVVGALRSARCSS